jgi:hypothetical protein
MQSSLAICGRLVPAPPSPPMDTKVHLKWCSIDTEPAHVLLYALNYLGLLM